MRLSKMKSGEFSRNDKYNFVLPIGATEQHGPYAPFGTDTYIINYLIDQIENNFLTSSLYQRLSTHYPKNIEIFLAQFM